MQTISVYDFFRLGAYSPEAVAAAIIPRAPARVDFFGVTMTARYATTRPGDIAAQYHRTITSRVLAYPNRIAPSMRARMVCGACGATGCKLWREYQTIADQTKILCAICALKDQKLPPGERSRIDANGKRETDHGRTDQIGGLVPAVPVGDTFWGYTSVPQEGVQWWRALPSYRLAPNMGYTQAT